MTCSSSIISVSSSWEYTRILSEKNRITFFGRTYIARLSIAKLRVVPIHRYRHYPNAQVYNLDIVKPGTPNPVVKDYKPALRNGQKLQSTFIEYDIRLLTLHTVSLSWWQRRFMRSGRMVMFAYPGRKNTIKACIYVKKLVRFMLYRLEHHEHGVELYNCCFEPAYTIQHIRRLQA